MKEMPMVGDVANFMCQVAYMLPKYFAPSRSLATTKKLQFVSSAHVSSSYSEADVKFET